MYKQASTAAADINNSSSNNNTNTMSGITITQPRCMPITLLSGFLGAGKTTLLKHILENRQGLKTAVIVNDMAELNIDASLIKQSKGEISLRQKEEKLVEMQNGCICCTLREDLVKEILELARQNRFDYCIIESTGVSEPMQVAETFTFPITSNTFANEDGGVETPSTPAEQGATVSAGDREEEELTTADDTSTEEDSSYNTTSAAATVSVGSKRKQSEMAPSSPESPSLPNQRQDLEVAAAEDIGPTKKRTKYVEIVQEMILSDVARLDCCVTVVDAFNFHKDLKSIETLRERYGGEVQESDERDVANLMMDQIEFANVILVNKVDLVTETQLQEIETILMKLNPDATVVRSVMCDVDHRLLLNTGMFDMEKAAMSAGWLKSIRGDGPTETEEYGIISFVYRRRRPFHPGKLFDLTMNKEFFSQESSGIIRSKGFFWLCTRHNSCGEWEQAGRVLTLRYGGKFFAGLGQEEWSSLDEDFRLEMLKDFDGPYGDRRQDLVFIGFKEQIDKEKVVLALDNCLVSEEEFAKGPEYWQEVHAAEDPFEAWNDFVDHHHHHHHHHNHDHGHDHEHADGEECEEQCSECDGACTDDQCEDNECEHSHHHHHHDHHHNTVKAQETA